MPVGSIALSNISRETYGNIAFNLDSINFKKHDRIICGQLKPVSLLMRHELNTPNLYVSLESGTEGPVQNIMHSHKSHIRETMTPDSHNVNHERGLTSQFTEALKHNMPYFRYMDVIFPKIYDAKTKVIRFMSPLINKKLR